MLLAEKRCLLIFVIEIKKDMAVFDPFLKDQCGWWSKESKTCGLIDLAEAVKSMRDKLETKNENNSRQNHLSF
jgi:hypothetical protein